MQYDLVVINQKLNSVDAKNLDELGGLEILIESLSRMVVEIMGKNTLLTMAYQIGREPAEKIADRILASRNGQLFEDPLEAMVTLMVQVKNFFQIQIEKVDRLENGQILVQFHNHCYFRTLITHRPGLKIGGPLCRITKGYLETAITKLSKWKTDVKLIQEDSANHRCVESITLIPPKPTL